MGAKRHSPILKASCPQPAASNSFLLPPIVYPMLPDFVPCLKSRARAPTRNQHRGSHISLSQANLHPSTPAIRLSRVDVVLLAVLVVQALNTPHAKKCPDDANPILSFARKNTPNHRGFTSFAPTLDRTY